jgi:hypothetical protein
MAWFRNHYECPRCGRKWTDEWSCMCDDDCRACGNRHISPHDSDDLTEIIACRGPMFVVLLSPESAGHSADYAEAGAFATLQQAAAFLEAAEE